MRQLAFIKNDMAEIEGRAHKSAALRKERRDGASGGIKPRQRDMRDKGACFGGDADARKQLVDLAVQPGERQRWLDPSPDHMRLSLAVEQADPVYARRNDRRVQRAKRRGNIFGAVTIDIADKAEREVKLVVILPARGGNAMHRAAQQIADWARRAQRDEQAMLGHGGQHSSMGTLVGTAIPN